MSRFLDKWGNTATAFSAIVIAIGSLWAGLDWLDARPVLERELTAEHDQIVLGLANLQQTTGKTISDLQRQVSDTATSVLVLTFYQLLDKLKQNGSLSFEDQQRLCAIASQLQYTGVPGCQSG